jgi:hypothetical protein
MRRLLPLSSLTGLTALKLQHCAGIRRSADLAPLSLLTALSTLNLSGCSQEEGAGISSLATLTCLRCAPVSCLPRRLTRDIWRIWHVRSFGSQAFCANCVWSLQKFMEIQ